MNYLSFASILEWVQSLYMFTTVMRPSVVLICIAVMLLLPGMFIVFHVFDESLQFTHIIDCVWSEPSRSRSWGEMLVKPLGSLCG